MKKTLVLGTALALLAATGVAYAGSNETYLDQLGNGNSASTGQDSAAVVGNQAGIASDSMKQTGDNNSLAITQSGDENKVGTHWNSGSNKGLGVDQNGDRNSITIDQSKNQNAVYEVQQTGAAGATSQQNMLTITQKTDGNAYGANSVVSVNQTNTGGVAANANTIEILQTDLHTGPGANNGIGRPNANGLAGGIIQEGSGLGVTVNQVGRHNKIFSIDQYGTGTPSNGTTITINQSGAAGNGSDGVDNAVRKVVQGTDVLGVSDSTVAINQYGSRNYIGLVSQTGGDGNHANLTFAGNDNGGSGNVGNNGTAGSFTALGVANSLATSGGLSESEVIQTGAGNNISYTVTGNENLFAFSQIGSGNTIDGTVGDTSASSSNEVAILQNSSGNTASFSQTGAGSNNLAIHQ